MYNKKSFFKLLNLASIINNLKTRNKYLLHTNLLLINSS